MNKFTYNRSHGYWISFVVAGVCFYVSSKIDAVVFEISLVIIGAIAAVTFYNHLAEEVSTYINRSTYAPVSIKISLLSKEKWEHDLMLTNLVIMINLLWIRNLPRMGETINLEDIIGEQYDFHLPDYFKYMVVNRIIHSNDTTQICTDITTTANAILSNVEKLHAVFSKLESSKIEHSPKSFFSENQLIIRRWPVFIEYEYRSDEFAPQLMVENADTQE